MSAKNSGVYVFTKLRLCLCYQRKNRLMTMTDFLMTQKSLQTKPNQIKLLHHKLLYSPSYINQSGDKCVWDPVF